MRCRQARRRLSAYLDGALSARGQNQVRGHLSECPDCREYSVELSRTWAMLELSEAPDTSPSFTAAVMRGIRAERTMPVWHAPRWAVAAAFAACLACGGLLGYVRSDVRGATEVSQVALAVDISQRLGMDAFAPLPADTLAGAYTQLTGSESGR
jgi:predicted anti-sigma-YlaC factor YlaD